MDANEIELTKLKNKYNKVAALKSKTTNAEKDAIIDEIVLLAKNNIIKKLEERYIDFGSINISKSEGEEQLNEVLHAFSYDKDKREYNFDFNYSALRRLPGEDLYTAVYSLMSHTLLEKNADVNAKNEYKFGKNVDVQNPNQNNKTIFGVILTYIKEFLKAVLGINENDHCAQEVAEEFSKSGITENDMFEMPEQANNAISQTNATISKISDNKELFKRRYAKLVKNGNDEQATYLLGVISKDEFEKVKSKNDNVLINFCKSYISAYLSSYGMSFSDVDLTFNEAADIGEYIDYGSSGHGINIDLKKVKARNNPMEVISDLSHELMHVIDSQMGKDDGLKYGLRDNLISSAKDGINSAKGENEEVKKFLNDLDQICYDVNPNERSARIGELVGLKFMHGMTSDKKTKDYILKSIDNYKNYQQEVVKSLYLVGDAQKLQELENKFKSIERSIKDESTKQLIRERLDYLKDLQKRNILNPENDQKALNEALGIKRDINTQAQEVGLETKELGE